MRTTKIIALLIACALTTGCAVAAQTLTQTLGSIGKSSQESPENDMRQLRNELSEARSRYYQDAKGLRPGLSSSIGEASPKLVELFEIRDTPVGIAPSRWTPNCQRNDAHVRAWQSDSSGVAAFFEQYPALAREAIRLKLRDDAFWVALNFQTSGGFQRIRMLEGSAAERVKEYKLEAKLDAVKSTLADAGRCPHAPKGLVEALSAYADAEYQKNIERMHAFFDHLLVQALEGKTMIPDAKHIKASDRRALDKLAHALLSEHKIVALRYVDNWHNVNQKEWHNNVLVHVHEDYTRINAYVDFGPDKPFIKCFALDGVRDYNAGKRLKVTFARQYGVCDSVPKR